MLTVDCAVAKIVEMLRRVASITLMVLLILTATIAGAQGGIQRSELVDDLSNVSDTSLSTRNEDALGAQLFQVFVGLRTALESDTTSVAKFYSREWLEDAINSAIRAEGEPEKPGLNWVKDALNASLGLYMPVEKVYAYDLLNSSSQNADLQLKVASCSGPYTLTLGFKKEQDAWRIATLRSDSTTKGRSWFKPTLKPIKEFKRIEVPDRSRYFNESHLGQSLGLSVKHKPCP